MGCSVKSEKPLDAFQKQLDESHREQNKIWVDEGSEFYNRQWH